MILIGSGINEEFFGFFPYFLKLVGDVLSYEPYYTIPLFRGFESKRAIWYRRAKKLEDMAAGAL